jgi:hypothetical protein
MKDNIYIYQYIVLATPVLHPTRYFSIYPVISDSLYPVSAYLFSHMDLVVDLNCSGLEQTMIEKRRLPSTPYDIPIEAKSLPYTQVELDKLIRNIKYEGNPRHKKKKGDFILQAGIRPSPKKTLCDISGIFRSKEALSLLKTGIMKGLISLPDPRKYEHRWPKCIWAMKDDIVLEARHTENGIYHGYPELNSNALTEIIKERWKG